MASHFRKVFKGIDKDAIQWFPKHMKNGVHQINQKMKMVDCVIEVHDARIPFSGRNTDFKRAISGTRPHILVLNKKDMSDATTFKAIENKIQKEEGIENVIFTNCRDRSCSGVKKLVSLTKKVVLNTKRFIWTDNPGYNIMIVGVPNVGKSSLTNKIRDNHLKWKPPSAVADMAGVTKTVLPRIKFSKDPLIFAFDTPGILTPRIDDTEQGMKLALVSCMQDSIIEYKLMADYLLFWLNKHRHFEYVKLFGLMSPTDNIASALATMSINQNLYQRANDSLRGPGVRPDIESAAQVFVKAFRHGELGKLNLDIDRM